MHFPVEYINKMSRSDKIARGFSPTATVFEIKNSYNKAIRPFTEKEKILINKMQKDLNKLLDNKWRNASNIPYECIKTVGIENDFPHTHGNIIFLPEKCFQTSYERLFKICVHEFIHVFQRTRPELTNILVERLGYRTICSRNDILQSYNLRLNPDIDDNIYMDKNGVVEIMVYSSDNPKSLVDTSNMRIDQCNVEKMYSNSICEHPYEYIAYNLTDVLIYGKSDHDTKVFKEWLNNFFYF